MNNPDTTRERQLLDLEAQLHQFTKGTPEWLEKYGQLAQAMYEFSQALENENRGPESALMLIKSMELGYWAAVDKFETRPKSKNDHNNPMPPLSEQQLQQQALQLTAVQATQCFFGIGVEQERPRALSLLQYAAEHHDPFAQTLLGSVLINSKDQKDCQLGRKWLQSACDKNYPLAQYCLGSYLSPQKDTNLIMQAANESYFAPAQTWIGNSYMEPKSRYQDVEKAVTALQNAARQNSIYAKSLLLLAYLQGKKSSHIQQQQQVITLFTQVVEQLFSGQDSLPAKLLLRVCQKANELDSTFIPKQLSPELLAKLARVFYTSDRPLATLYLNTALKKNDFTARYYKYMLDNQHAKLLALCKENPEKFMTVFRDDTLKTLDVSDTITDLLYKRFADNHSKTNLLTRLSDERIRSQISARAARSFIRKLIVTNKDNPHTRLIQKDEKLLGQLIRRLNNVTDRQGNDFALAQLMLAKIYHDQNNPAWQTHFHAAETYNLLAYFQRITVDPSLKEDCLAIYHELQPKHQQSIDQLVEEAKDEFASRTTSSSSDEESLTPSPKK